MKQVAVIAGRGRLPVAFAREANRVGVPITALGVTNDVDNELARYTQFYQLSLGTWQAVIDALHAAQVEDVYLLGKVSKEYLFSGAQFDQRFYRVVSQLPVKNDDAIITAFVNDLAQEGLTVQPQHALLPGLMPGPGLLTQRALDNTAWRDVIYGYTMAKSVAGLDIGQTCVVRDGAVLAIEAIEGTDECIRRGGRLSRGGAVVVKVAKPHQDARFDVPTVGLDTLAAMIDVGAKVLAFEAGATFVLDQDELTATAIAAGISIIGYRPGMAENR